MSNVSLFIGSIAPLPDSGRPTGMFKHPVGGALNLGDHGFAGDEQADLRVHGGPDKAVHLYPAVHYGRLAHAFPEAASQLKPGSLGENISSATLDESLVRIGDVFRLGAALLQVCQPRNPCWKIDARFGVDGMAAFIAENHLTGWYFRVLLPGLVVPGDALDLVEPGDEGLNLAQAQQLWRQHRPAPLALRQLAAAPGIAEGWRRKIVERADWLEKHAPRPSPPPAFHVKRERH
ncbi:MAG: MOSC domain-containing protein [Dechloromonas sp.]|nr:MAG: MOSC domain-containing protein [Dechloromonas sp.]